ALCIIVGILVALWITQRRYSAMGGNSDTVWDAAIVIIPAGIVGGRLYHVITDYDKYFCADCNPVDALKITNGGLGIWGAVALGAVAVWVMFKIKGIPLGPLADAVAPGLVLAQGIGRLGNWVNQGLYGADTTDPAAMALLYRGDGAGTHAAVSGHARGGGSASVHPSFLCELIWNVLVCLFLLWAHKAWKLGHGRVFALYVAGYTLGRFFIENMRADDATMVFGVRINVIVSVVVFIVAVIIFLSLKKGQETPDEVDPKYHAKREQQAETDEAVTSNASVGKNPPAYSRK